MHESHYINTQCMCLYPHHSHGTVLLYHHSPGMFQYSTHSQYQFFTYQTPLAALDWNNGC